MVKRDYRDESCGIGELLLASLKGTLLGIAVLIGLSLIMTAVSLGLGDPMSALNVLAYAALGIGAFACGMASFKWDSQQSLLTSVIGGAMYVLILWLISLFIPRTGESMPAVWTAVAYAACVIVSLIGGLMAKPRRERFGEGRKSPAAVMRKQLGKR